ncbi:cytochrome-c oxidase, cbb3-type subunit III [Pararhodospirillum oryzae]|uniref:Cbb3-type cytochrome c oxidase subunit n=1 Tax=Pararhodospirillum oryzae TaxID=478448 RepID=A0A512HAN4_9PROT|nr:cytochrome-c oxidase, cbb3-type subunit III [Pararhodospirillum oryzae]GEO82450.1 Cbb3-type cytochrome c oxidase subunit [Pararhodospirillum oryzae]
MAGTPEYDPITGRSTTGHEWDGIKELNTPLPVWWVWVFYVCIAWSVLYVVFFPALPLGDRPTEGLLGWHSRTALDTEVARADALFHNDKTARLATLGMDEIMADPDLRAYATRAGAVIFKDNCAPCHQAGGAGTYGFPTLADDEWLWGGTPDDILTTVMHGIRDTENYADTRFNVMPAFDYLSPEDQNTLADYVLATRAGTPPDGPGKTLFEDNCAVCHASTSEGPIPDGNQVMGAPALNNAIWLYKGTKEAIVSQIRAPQNGVMPGWAGRLRDSDIKAVAVYVHGLGGGR